MRPSLPPAPPTFGEAVAVPVARVGDDPVIYSAKVLAALRRANARLADDKAFYQAVLQDFSHAP